MKRLVVALLVALVVLTGLPVFMGGAGMTACPECGPLQLPCSPDCVPPLASFGVLAVMLVGSARTLLRPERSLLYAVVLDHPPRLP